ncbi:MAG: hypothetical protein JXJ17_19150 [Anaerolineae bacterium]|nr:hypothetical protein [Anaerolineae bacterium]
MSEKCEFSDQCPILILFGEIGKHVTSRRYCYGDFESCSRHQLHAAGKPVPENLLPTADIGQIAGASRDENAALYQTII